MVERYSLSYRNGAYYLSELLEGGAQLVDAHEYDRLTALTKELAEALEYAQRCVHGEYRKPIDAALQKYKEQQS